MSYQHRDIALVLIVLTSEAVWQTGDEELLQPATQNGFINTKIQICLWWTYRMDTRQVWIKNLKRCYFLRTKHVVSFFVCLFSFFANYIFLMNTINRPGSCECVFCFQTHCLPRKEKKERGGGAWKDQIWVSIFSSNRLGPQGLLFYLLRMFWLRRVSLIIPHNKRHFLGRIFMPLKGVSTKQKQILSLTLHTWKMASLWTMQSNEFQQGKLQWSSHYYFSGIKLVNCKGGKIYSTPKLNCGNYACQKISHVQFVIILRKWLLDGRHVKTPLVHLTENLKGCSVLLYDQTSDVIYKSSVLQGWVLFQMAMPNMTAISAPGVECKPCWLSISSRFLIYVKDQNLR